MYNSHQGGKLGLAVKDTVLPTKQCQLEILCPQPGKDSFDDSSCDQCESGLSEVGQVYLPLSCLEPLDSVGQQTELAKMQGKWVRMFIQRKDRLPSPP